jgi:hypothetical protein
MKKILCFFFLLLFILSCASTHSTDISNMTEDEKSEYRKEQNGKEDEKRETKKKGNAFERFLNDLLEGLDPF